MKKIYFKTFGCRTNLYDTQVMISNLGTHKLALSEADADVIVINSCTVTNHSDALSRTYAAKMRREYPQITILFTGCGVKSVGRGLLANGVISGVFGHSEKARIAFFAEYDHGEAFEFFGDENSVEKTVISSFEGKTKAFIKVQEGCDFACSYCIIPSVRGRARSYDEKMITDQVKQLADNGFEEFILTGTNTGSFGQENGKNLAKLIIKIGKIDGVKRIRIGSIESVQIDDELLELLDAPFMAKHLHIALQHTNDEILTKMNRRNRYNTDLELLMKIHDHGYALGTDFIVGFPMESDLIFDDACAKLMQMPLTHIHLFAFSPRDGTAAAAMKGRIDGNIVAARQQMIRDIIAKKHREFYAETKRKLEILMEQNGTGYDQYFTKISIASEQRLNGWITTEKYDIDQRGKIVAKL